MQSPFPLDPYAYPDKAHSRRHGPHGYADYSSYREWLRDEFEFRCVFCLRRERWDTRTSTWHLDHLVPQSIAPDKRLVYDNLLYVCHTCNSIKGDLFVPDPCSVAYGAALAVDSNGHITAGNADGEILIDVLRLDNPDHTEYRHRVLRTLRSLYATDSVTFRLWMSYPDDLPDLAKLRAPGNMKPAGIQDSYFARRQRGELPELY